MCYILYIYIKYIKISCRSLSNYYKKDYMGDVQRLYHTNNANRTFRYI